MFGRWCWVMLFVGFSKFCLAQVTFDSTYTEHFRRCGANSGWNAGDATISIPLPDGRALWLFGDSYSNRPVCATHRLSCLFDVRNCMMIQSSTDDSVFETRQSAGTGYARSTFKYGTDNQINYFLWPGHGFVEGDTTYIFMHRWYSADGLNIDSFAGNFIAKLNTNNLQIYIIDTLPLSSDFHFGRAVIRNVNDGFYYVYNNRQESGIYRLYVSRTPISSPLQSWQFYNGSTWVNDISQSQSISPVAMSPSFSAFMRNGLTYIVTQEPFGLFCGEGREIYAMESPDLVGPFELKRLLYTVKDTLNGKYLATYNAQAHPWENGDLLISYNVNDRASDPINCPAECHTHTSRSADTYRPKFIRVPYSNLRIQGLLDQTSLIVVAGQSNAVGQGNSDHSVKPNEGSAFQINLSKRLLYPVADPVGYNDISTGFQPANTGSFLPALAKSLNENCGRIPLLVHTARSNTYCTPLPSVSTQNSWSATGSLFGHCVNRINAISDLTGRFPEAVIWSQGESDGGEIRLGMMNQQQYHSALSNLITRFRNEFGSELPFLIIKTGKNTLFNPDPGFDAVRNVQELVSLSDPLTTIVYDSTFYFPELGFMGDFVHYNQDGLNTIGMSAGDSICRFLYADDYIEKQDYTVLSDEFENSCSQSQWTHVSDSEGWNALHMNHFSINENEGGQCIMEPHTTVWYADYKGPFYFKLASGDFMVSTDLTFSNRQGNDIPGSDFSLAGIMIRSPKNLTTGPSGWTAGQENYIFISSGYASDQHPSCPGCPGPHFEIKSTVNSTSNLNILPLTTSDVLLRAVRVFDYIFVLYSVNNGQTFDVAGRFYRNDMPDTVQIGLVTYTNWEKASTYTPVFHNDHDLVPGLNPDPSNNPSLGFNPDLVANFDYFRMEGIVLPGMLRGLNLLDTNIFSDAQLLNLFGQLSIANREYSDAFIWNGHQDNDWHNVLNWQGGVLPGSGDRVIIPDCSCPEVHCPEISTSVTIRSLIISENGELGINATGILNIYDQSDDYSFVFNNFGNFYLSGECHINLEENKCINRGNITILSNGICNIIQN